MVSQMELSDSTEKFHVGIPLEVFWNLLNAILEMHPVLAINIIYQETFTQSMAVEPQAIANWIIDVYLPSWLNFCLAITGASDLPFSLLQITDRSWDKTAMPGTTGGHNTSHIQVPSIIRACCVYRSMVATWRPLVRQVSLLSSSHMSVHPRS